MSQGNIDKQNNAVSYYDKFSKVYDVFAPDLYYHKARLQAIKELQITEGDSILNVPIGTGQNLEYFQQHLNGNGLIIGVDISAGMLDKAKIVENEWHNTKLLNHNVTTLNFDTFSEFFNDPQGNSEGFDAILCDLGLSGFPQWRDVIDNLISLLAPNGRISIMDWYIEKPTIRGEIVKWIGKGEVDRPIWQYLETKVADFKVDSSFNRGDIFVASGTKMFEV